MTLSATTNGRGIGGSVTGATVAVGVTAPDTVTNLTGLAAVPNTDASLQWVQSVQCFWRRDPTSTLVPDGITVIAALGGGNWERITGTTSQVWLFQAAWYIDPAAGSDENDGTTAGTAIKSIEEFNRRVSVGNLHQNTTLNIQTVFAGSRTVIASVDFGINVTVQSPTSVAYAGPDTFQSVTVRTHAGATPEATLVKATNLASFQTYVGKRIKLASGALAWIAKYNPQALGNNVARTSVFQSAAYAEVVPAVGNSFTIEDLIAHTGSLTLQIKNANTITLRDMQLAGVCVDCPTASFYLDGCKVSGQITGRVGVGAWSERCFHSATSPLEHGITPWWVWKCCLSSGGVWSRVGGYFFWLCTFQLAGNGQLLLGSEVPVEVDAKDCQFFDQTGRAAIYLCGPASFACTGNLSGTGCKYGLFVDTTEGGPQIFNWLNANVPNIKGTTSEITVVNGVTVNLSWATCRFRSNEQSGTATLGAGGTVTVTARNANTAARIMLTRNTPGGTLGQLSAPAASRAAGQFVINSSDAADVSTVDWFIPGWAQVVAIGSQGSGVPPV